MTEEEIKEFDPRLKSETRLKQGWFHLKLFNSNRVLADQRRGFSSLNPALN